MLDSITTFFKNLVWFKKSDGTQEQVEVIESVVDTYLVADSFETLARFCSHFRNVIGPIQGTAATEDAPASGDPAFWYCCVRAPMEIVPLDGVAACDVEIGKAVCGVWA